MTKPIRVALRSTHFKNNPFISDITIVFILYAISPSRVDRGAEMGRNPYIFGTKLRLPPLLTTNTAERCTQLLAGLN